jgi:hypothetical protein
MAQGIQFRKILPIIQTALAVVLGGWGLWLRNSILSRPFLVGTTFWDSTARFHVWPWPFKFAAVLNMPAFLVGSLLSLPLGAIFPRLPELISIVPVLLLVPLLWYWIGSWLDNSHNADANKNASHRKWFLLLVFTAICAAASSIPRRLGGYVSYLPAGVAVWIIAALFISASKAAGSRDS